MWVITLKSDKIILPVGIKQVYFRQGNTSRVLTYPMVKKVLNSLKLFRLNQGLYTENDEKLVGRIIQVKPASKLDLDKLDEITKPIVKVQLLELTEMEKILIRKTILYFKGDLNKASKNLGIDKRTLNVKMKKHNINKHGV
jgi:DNA-binding protein Fis